MKPEQRKCEQLGYQRQSEKDKELSPGENAKYELNQA